MNQKNLIIINSSKKVDIDQKNVSYINIGDGIVNIRDSKKIILSKFRSTNYLKYKNLLINELSKKVKDAERKIPFISEFEIFNLRNDKNTNIDLILNILIIKEIIKKQKFKKITLITDNKLTKNLFKKNNSKIKIIYLGSSFGIPRMVLPSIIKFYFKALFVIIFSKFFHKIKLSSNKFNEACLSIYPIFFNKKENFFDDEKKIKFNFLLTDETHLNSSFLDIIKAINEPKEKNLIHIESIISITSFVKAFFKSILYYLLTLRINLTLKVNNVDLSSFYKDYIFISLINRLKLNIYDDCIIIALKKFNIKTFNLYLFEYNFGFFLINLIKKKSNNTKVIGYQHGIFSNQLLWLDLILKNKNRYNYLPHEIKSFNLHSFYDYKEKINSKKIKFILLKKKRATLVDEYVKSEKKIYANKCLVLPGTHDANNIYNALKIKTSDKKNKFTFFLKFHPKKKLISKDTNNIKIITTIKNKKFANVLISATSTLVYDFIESKKNFMVYDIDYKHNLISDRLKKKVKFYYF